MLIDESHNSGEMDEHGAFYVADIVTDSLKSDYIAVSFAYKHVLPSKSFKLPFVCLYLCSSRPHFSATFISIIDNQSSSNDGIEKLIVPEEVSFHRRQGHARKGGSISSACGPAPVQVAVRWSNKVVSFSPCHVCADRPDYS
jgi:hypothetical protein